MSRYGQWALVVPTAEVRASPSLARAFARCE